MPATLTRILVPHVPVYKRWQYRGCGLGFSVSVDHTPSLCMLCACVCTGLFSFVLCEFCACGVCIVCSHVCCVCSFCAIVSLFTVSHFFLHIIVALLFGWVAHPLYAIGTHCFLGFPLVCSLCPIPQKTSTHIEPALCASVC